MRVRARVKVMAVGRSETWFSGCIRVFHMRTSQMLQESEAPCVQSLQESVSKGPSMAKQARTHKHGHTSKQTLALISTCQPLPRNIFFDTSSLRGVKDTEIKVRVGFFGSLVAGKPVSRTVVPRALGGRRCAVR